PLVRRLPSALARGLRDGSSAAYADGAIAVGTGPRLAQRRRSEMEASMKSQRLTSMNRVLSSSVLRIATDPRTWVLAGALATAGGRAVTRWRTRFDFRDRTILITGGTRGLGLELARQARLPGARAASG